MSDNITREPYRNAWYKQLSDAVKKHDEEIAEMTPHLVPDVEEGDNGKILIAGEEGAFDWGQPPEELPVITEGDEGKVLKVDEGVPKWLEDKDAEIPSHTASDEGKMLSVNAQNGLEWKDVPKELPAVESTDEGKVLKVDEGVPKWLEDTDSEYLLVTVTESGDVYTADKTFDQILPYAQAGKCVLLYSSSYYSLSNISSTQVRFRYYMNTYGANVSDTSAPNVSNRVINYFKPNYITISANGVTFQENHWFASYKISVSHNTNITELEKKILSACLTNGVPVELMCTYNSKNYTLYPAYYDSNNIVFVSGDNEIKATIVSRLVTITQIPTLPTSTSADEGKVVMVDSNGDYVLGTPSINSYPVPFNIEQINLE